MKPADNREEVLFRKARQRPVGPEREAYLDQACAGNQALRFRLEALLQAHESPDPFLEPPAGPPGPTNVLSTPLTEKPGDRIGRYKLLQQIGEGGCGVVYMAEQEQPLRRRVALKVIKLGMDTKHVIARFEAERQALALMDHPNIAKVLDAGATGTGRPYFVMELVRGIKITDFCDQKNLSTRDRLDLFIQVCRAIQHAHQKGIIHRDIKPSNILVTVNDGVAVPKVIDFGIAKATNQHLLTDKTLFTAFEQFLGTPAYVSPEQAEMTSLDIDTRADIYSLGVLLYELLTGKTPFDVKELLQAGLEQMRRTIRVKEPPWPSTRLGHMEEEELTTTAKRRATDARGLVSLLRGDMDCIVMKCLQKDPAIRYQTASGLAADIQRHLSNEPITARPPSIVYRFQKSVRRQLAQKARFTAAVIAVSAVISLLLGGVLLLHRQNSSSENLNTELRLHVVSKDGKSIFKARCTLIVGGYPSSDNGFPMSPKEENRIIKDTDTAGDVVFRHQGLSYDQRHILYVSGAGYSGATIFLDPQAKRPSSLNVALFKKRRVTISYVFQPSGSLQLTGPSVLSGNVTLDPMEGGSYRPPANAFFSFKQNKKVGSGGVLDIGIAVDQRAGLLHFGESGGRFDHCTDLGIMAFESLSEVDTNKLVRERKDTPILQGHTYVYESNIYPPAKRTSFTGLDVKYAKIFVQSIEDANETSGL